MLVKKFLDEYPFFLFHSMIGSDSSTTNYPGKIPPGPGISDMDELVKKDEPKS